MVGLGLSEIRDFNEQHPGLPIKTNHYEGLYEDGKTPALVNRSFVEWKEGSNHNSIIFDVVRPFNVDLPTHLQITENINAQEKTYQRNDLLVSGQDSFISSHKVRNLSDLILIENGFLKLTSTYMEAVMSEDKKETQSHEKQAEERIYIRPSLKNDDREILKQIPGHQYNPKIRIWSVPKAALKNSDPRILDMQMYANFNDIFSKKEISKEAKAVLLQIDKKVEHKLKR